MKDLTYSAEYWEHVGVLANQPSHACEKCGRGRSPAVVIRLALRNPKKPANDWRNVGLFCLKCRRNPLPVRERKPEGMPLLDGLK